MKQQHHLTFFAGIALVALALIIAAGAMPSVAAPASYKSIALQSPPSAMQAALAEADVVVRVRVAQSTSAWTPDHTAIRSTNTLSVRYMLRGTEMADLIVETVGGYLPAEELYMISPDLPTLSGGEEAILFLAKTGDRYAIVGGQDGKYTVRAGQVLYAGGLFEEPIASFYARLQALDPAMQLPA
ncbi:MAG: hypothetical protein KDD91_20105, partial [Caldilinea sp.]|nr:hypothetical protein [Caldilinea sp.]